MTSIRLDSVRIIIVVRYFGLGGAERQAVSLARFLKERGATVLVWSFTDGLHVRELLDEDGIASCVLSPGIGGGFVPRVLKMSRFIFKMRQFRPDLLMPFTDLPNKICCALRPLIGASASLWNQRDEGREMTGRPLEKIAIKMTRCFVANSESGAVFLNQNFGVARDRIHLIANGVQLQPITRSAEDWRARLDLEDDTFVATMLANLHHFKDHRTLLRAWARVTKKHNNAVLLLAGHAFSIADELEALANTLGIESQVRFFGRTDDVSGLLAMSDLAVFSSYLEGCPNGILEPMASGLAVVATDFIGSREVLGEEYRFLIEKSDPDAFADAILELIGDQDQRDRVGAANQRRAEREFDPSTTLQSYLPIINRLLGR